MYVLLVTHEDQLYPVCSDGWLNAWNTATCHQMAFGCVLDAVNLCSVSSHFTIKAI